MIICPDCMSSRGEDFTSSCASCNWQPAISNNVPVFLSTVDRKSGMFDDFVECYEELASKNLEESNIDRRFLLNQAKNIVSYIGDVSNARVCDVGVGQGKLTQELLANGAAQVTAVDVSPSYLQALSGDERIRPILANAENLPFKDEFDVIVSTDVMEHVLNVGSFLFSINRALKSGGKFCVRVPYREPLLSYSPHRGYKHSFGHLRSFNKDILQLNLRQAGFEKPRFYLDGFSLGTPHPFLYDRAWKRLIYHGIVKTAKKFVDHEADVNLWDSRLARIFMRPVEIVAVARKVRELDS